MDDQAVKVNASDERQRQQQRQQEELAHERDRLRLLLEVNNAVTVHLNPRELMEAISDCLQRVTPHDYISLTLHEPESGGLRIHGLRFPAGTGRIHQGMFVPIDDSPAGRAFVAGTAVLLGPADVATMTSEIAALLLSEGLRSFCCVPLISRARGLGALTIAALRDGAFGPAEAELLEQIAGQVAIAVENAMAFQQIAELKDRLAEEKVYLEGEIRTKYNFEKIIGDSVPLKRALKDVETVAPTDSTVLIRGETGTGKELIARAIHHLSPRREHTFVTLNCAAVASSLLESELFGHEKGAFTGAISQRIGRFELADRGTLFLDEVGDIPLDLQPKLLRVLQEQEFERVGGTRPIRVNVRVVAATHRNLQRMVADRQFREDLFYRLNVFPIVLPPLRQRREDIPVLVRHFVQKFGQQMGKRIDTIPTAVLAALTQYAWPGNVRELENLIERAVILSRGHTLNVPLAELRNTEAQAEPHAAAPPGAGSGEVTSLDDAEREHIRRVLHETNWVIGGPNGAAARLGVKRTTLQSRIKKLGITRAS